MTNCDYMENNYLFGLSSASSAKWAGIELSNATTKSSFIGVLEESALIMSSFASWNGITSPALIFQDYQN